MNEINKESGKHEIRTWGIIRWIFWTFLLFISIVSLFLLYTEFLGQDIFLFYKPFISIFNFLSLNTTAILFAFHSIRSVMPVTREENVGEKAWDDCYQDRLKMSLFIAIMIINMILWIWYPLEVLNIQIFEDSILGVIIGICITIPCLIMLYFALKHGGIEHMKPMKETKLHGGIYNYIRHPGIWGEMPLYIALGFFINSFFITMWAIIFVVLYVPLYIYYEEQDLIKRFGQPYIEYRENVGALIPKIWQKKGKSKNEA